MSILNPAPARVLLILWISSLGGCATTGEINREFKGFQAGEVSFLAAPLLGPGGPFARQIEGIFEKEMDARGLRHRSSLWGPLAHVFSRRLPGRIHPDDLARACDRCGLPLLALQITRLDLERGRDQQVVVEGVLALYEPGKGHWVWRRSIQARAIFPLSMTEEDLCKSLVQGDPERDLVPWLEGFPFPER